MDDFFPEPRDDTPPAAVEPNTKRVVFEDLTLGQALGYLFWRPVETSRLFWKVLTRDSDGVPAPKTPDDNEPPGGEPDMVDWTPVETELITGEPVPDETVEPEVSDQADVWRAAWDQIRGLVFAVPFAILGGVALHRAATDLARHFEKDTGSAGFWFMLAGLFVVGDAVRRSRFWWARLFPGPARALYDRFHKNDLPYLWITGLLLVMAIPLYLLLMGLGGLPGLVVWLVLVGVLMVVLVLGMTPAQDSVIDTVQEVAVSDQAMPDRPAARSGGWLWANAYRIALVPIAVVLSALAYRLNVTRDSLDRVTDVVFTTSGFVAWVMSIGLWVGILAVGGVHMRGIAERARGRLTAIRVTWVGITLVALMVLGAWFRLYDLRSTPPEMTSDHIEKLLDALRVGEGYRGVFFPNNGGREGFQMYAVAAIADWFGRGYSFDALKLATIVEGVLTIPVLWWMARQVFGANTEHDRRLGDWVGVALAGLVAISSWHVMLSRLGLRIVLTPLTTALVVGFLARAMRHNRRADYAALGVVLGAGVYFYQANRMLPLVVGIGIVLAVLGQVRTWQAARQLVGDGLGFAALVVFPLAVYWYTGRLLEQSSYNNTRNLGESMLTFLPMAAMVWLAVLGLYARGRRNSPVVWSGGGLLATIVIALAVYIPMYHYSELRPDDFWNRTRGRLFGEDAFVRIDPRTGSPTTYEPGIGEQIERFWDQRAVFQDNYERASKMYHWEGDGGWISNAHSRPALDGVTGGLVILGAMLWGVQIFRRRDPVLWLLPVIGLVMLLPSALTLAYTIENPSFTRASGTIPVIFLLAALPVGLVGQGLSHVHWRRLPVGTAVALLVLVTVLGLAFRPNWNNYFTKYRLSYSYSWKPYREIAQPLKAFAQGEGSYGNAFMVAYPHWLDHRILGTMAGDIRWPNGLVTREDIFVRVQLNDGTAYAYDALLPIFVMFHANDSETKTFLEQAFPGGTTEIYEYTYETETGYLTGSFNIYRVWAGQIAPVQTTEESG